MTRRAGGETGRRAALLGGAGAALVSLGAGVAYADVALAPGPGGGVGALLVAGPLLAGKSQKRAAYSADFPLPDAIDPSGKGIRVGAVADEVGKRPWQLLASSSGAIDLGAQLKAQGVEATAAAFATLRVTAPLVGYLSVGVDDGVVVVLDGKVIFARDEPRAGGEDDALVPVELAPGDHALLLKLHQRGGAWTLRLKVTDRALAAARGVRVVLPGEVDAAKLASDLADVSLDRGLSSTGLAPRLTVRVRGGIPEEAPRDVTAAARRKGASLFHAAVGRIAVEPGGPASDLVALLPRLLATELPDEEGVVTFETSVFGQARTFDAFPQRALSAALGHADVVLPKVRARPAFLKDPDATAATIEHLVHRLVTYAGKGDADVRAQLDEAAWLEEVLANVERGVDPLLAVRGARRVAHRSRLDGKPSSFGLYMPTRVVLDGSKKYPLVVALHGLNGKPLNMMRWFFGRDDEAHDGEWEDRHPGAFPDVDAIVVTPMAHFNSMYRYAGEEDVMDVVRWAKRMLPVDEDRVSITGPSMGGTGTASIAFRYADQFSSAAPLCGYHSWGLRGDFAGKKRPWEAQLGDDRSTVSWAPNGLHLPLYIVHGTRDLPVENSGVLIDRYKSLGYALLEEHPDEGHNVWQPTYEGLKGYGWLTSHRRPAHPSRVVLRTDNLRYDRHAWVRILELARSTSWGEVTATVAKRAKTPRITVKTSGVAALHLDRDEKLVDASSPVTLELDGTTLSFEPAEALEATLDGGVWKKGYAAKTGLVKKRALSGPIRDVFQDPVIVVYGTQDPELSRANEQVARHFAAVRAGFDIAYPVVADVDFDPSLAASHAVVLVGGDASNLVTRALDERLPIHVRRGAGEIAVGDATVSGKDLGAAFVYPNPDAKDRYVVVIAGTTVPATLRAMSLPDLLPDYVVWDEGLGRARGGMILGAATLRAGGMFDEAWRIGKPLQELRPERVRFARAIVHGSARLGASSS